jgi:hypothetical protein
MASLFGLGKCIVALNKRMMQGSKPSDVNVRDSSFQITNYVICVLLSQGAYPHNTGQSHGCSTDVVLGHSKHPSNIHWTARHPHRRAFRGRKNVRRPTQIGADGHPRFIIPDINMTFLGFDFAFRNKYLFPASNTSSYISFIFPSLFHI